MNKSAVLVVLVSVCLLVSTDDSDKRKGECKFWNQQAQALSMIHQTPMAFGTKIYMQCKGGCSNMTCSGNLKQPGLFGMDGIDMDFCFGIQLNHCEDPVRMQYYLQLPMVQNTSFVGNITHNSTYEIPVPALADLPMGDNVKLIVFVEMVKDGHSIRFKMSGKVRVMEGNNPVFPFQKTIFPETRIDIPDCPRDRTTLNDFKPPKECKAPPPPSDVRTTPVPKTEIKSNTYHKTCEIGLAKCNSTLNEMCVAVGENTHSRNGRCECNPAATFNPDAGYCTPNSATSIMTTIHSIVSTPKPGVTQATTKDGGKKKLNLVPIIVGSVAGFVALLVVGILVIVFVGRRKRVARYRDQQQLLSDDMMDEEDDTVGPI